MFIRRLFCVVLVMLCFSGCTNKKDVTSVCICNNFSCSVNGSYDKLEIDGKLAVLENGKIVFELQKPQTLSGLKIISQNKKVYAEYFGLKKELSSETLPQTALITVISEILESSSISENLSVEKAENGYIAIGKHNDIDYEIDINDNLQPTRIVSKCYNIDLNLSDFE